MSSRGLVSLLAIPPTLRPVLLQALAATATPRSALGSPAIGTSVQCLWKSTTSRTAKKKPPPSFSSAKKKADSPSKSSKKAGPSSASSQKRSAPSRPPKGKNPNGYPKTAPGAAPPRASKGKNPNGYPKGSKASPDSRPTGSRGKNPNGYPSGPKTPSRAPRPEASDRRNTTSYPSKTNFSWEEPPVVQKEKTRFPPRVKASKAAEPPISSKKPLPRTPKQATPPEPATEKTPFPQSINNFDSLEPQRAPTCLSFLPPPPTLPITATPAPQPSKLDLVQAATIFRAPKFLYSAPRFLNLPYNTRMPEVCLLGRSNVGKSTLINALGGFGGKRAGTVHETSHGKLAITSSTAGCTKTMNAYGFGPPASIKPLSRKQQQARKDGGLSRSQKRAGETKVHPEALPRHSMVMMDMPGYGKNSRADWGEEILKYLNRREILSGAVLLIDAVAGVKEGDRGVLEVLRDAGLRTSVVLTKADKLVTTSDPAAWRGSAGLREACEHVWEEVRRVEGAGELSSWWENEGWTPEIFVTGAGDPKMGGMGVDGARMAIARLAGLVDEPVREVEKKGPEMEMVPYDQLVFSVPSAMPKFVVKQKPEEEVVRERQALLGRGQQRPQEVVGRERRPVVGRGQRNPEDEAVAERRPVVGRGRTRVVRAAAKAPVDQMQAMQAAVTVPRKRSMGKASF